MDPIKEAFQKVRQDMEVMNSEIAQIRGEMAQTREELIRICEILMDLDKKYAEKQEKTLPESPTQESLKQTTPTHNPTHQHPFEPLKGENMPFSTGNRGVPTDRQTHQQTDRHIEKEPIFEEKRLNQETFAQKPDSIDDAARILDSLDTIKKEIRLKFKRLTSQEMAVFSMIYQVETEEFSDGVDYKVLATRLGLTESSVRDYVGRIMKKGIPLEKSKINNKTVKITVSQNLKKIASLPTILQLRDL